jgi:hypothetical protein
MTAAKQQERDDTKHHRGQLVTITLDSVPRTIEEGVYKVAELKTKFSIPAEYELDVVVNGEFKPLNNERSIHIKGGEVFVSHVPQGGAA